MPLVKSYERTCKRIEFLFVLHTWNVRKAVKKSQRTVGQRNSIKHSKQTTRKIKTRRVNGRTIFDLIVFGIRTKRNNILTRYNSVE